MEKAQMFYREVAPSDDLRPFVLSFWEFAVPSDAPSVIAHEIFPDGCVSLFYIRNLSRSLHIVGVSRLHLETVTKPVMPGDTFWGMRISPAACSRILKMDAGEMLNAGMGRRIEIPHLSDGLAEKLKAAKSFDNAISIFEDRLREIIADGEYCDLQIAEAVRLIEDAHGEIRVDLLAKVLGLSTRQFQRRFKASSGLSPKQYIRTRRIRATAVNLVEKRDQNWADRAAELGFADQSHLAHEFVSVTKRSPNTFAEKVRKIKHGNLVK